MTPANEDKAGDGRPPERSETGKVDKAFDLWLQRGLHQIFDAVASEPVPEELLRLIDEDRSE
ncbi:MAG: hypothetical protein INR65_07960 [Gluconacetobacter diazotrophicus]|nr:hypothetical protein [Gluconacetobacter diazotrophicus]